MDEAAILFANEAFYLAFSHRDLEAMDRLWVRNGPVVCIHPGWPALTERAAIISSWEKILSNPNSPPVKVHDARVFTQGKLASVVCYETLQEIMLVATNIFKQEKGKIRLLHHQAGHCVNPPSDERNSIPNVH